jgi:hypothetical protein
MLRRAAAVGVLAILAAAVSAAAAQTPGVPVSTSPPLINGGPVEGQTLTESHAGWTHSPTSYAYRWYDCDGLGGACAAISGANMATYTLGARDVGHTIRVAEIAVDAAGSSGLASSAPTQLVYAPGQQSRPPVIATAPSIAGAPYVGAKIQASTGTWASVSPLTYAYQWQRCRAGCRVINGAIGRSYTATSADRRWRLRVVVTASNGFGAGNAAASRLSAAVGPPNTEIGRPLLLALTPAGKQGRLHGILAARGYGAAFVGVVPGRLSLQWWFLPKGTHLGQVYGKILPVLVATGTARITRARRITLRMTLTSDGGTLLADNPSVRLTGEGTFAPSGRPSIKAIATFTLSG